MQFDDQRVDTSRVNDQRDGRGGGGFGGSAGGAGMGSAGAAMTAGILAQLLRGKGGKGMLVMLVIVGLLLFAPAMGSGALPGGSEQASVTTAGSAAGYTPTSVFESACATGSSAMSGGRPRSDIAQPSAVRSSSVIK